MTAASERCPTCNRVTFDSWNVPGPVDGNVETCSCTGDAECRAVARAVAAEQSLRDREAEVKGLRGERDRAFDEVNAAAHAVLDECVKRNAAVQRANAAKAERDRYHAALIAIRSVTIGGNGHGRSGALDALALIRETCTTALAEPTAVTEPEGT